MPSPAHLIFENGFVRSTRYPKRCGDAWSIIRSGRWPSGETITGSDAVEIARFLKPGHTGEEKRVVRYPLHGA